MSEFLCDLHIHSCLSPCGEEEMTPWSIAGMARLNGLDIAALTDHNACGNCAPFFTACARYGVVPVAGMELTTSEDVHLLCLFRTLAGANAFAAVVEQKRVRMRNRPEIFGRQQFIGPDDGPDGEEEDLLVNATSLSLDEAAQLTLDNSGAAIPAHIDREANGVLAILGELPEKPDFPTVEIRNPERVDGLKREHPNLYGKRMIISSDAHSLWRILEPGYPIELPCPSDADEQAVRDALIDYLNGVPDGGRA